MDRIYISGMVRRSDKRVDHPQIESRVNCGKKCHDVEILNISRVGLRFRSSEKYKKGEKLLFELRGCKLNANLSIKIKGRVINEYNSKAEGEYEYGVKFIPLMQWNEMHIIHNFVHENLKTTT